MHGGGEAQGRCASRLAVALTQGEGHRLFCAACTGTPLASHFFLTSDMASKDSWYKKRWFYSPAPRAITAAGLKGMP